MLLAALCAGLTIPHVAAIESVDTPESPPNILFIMTDEMRWDSMGIAGHPLAKTPNIDRLAGEGSYYSTAYTSAPICSPSRRAFFTGRYSHQHGVVDNTKQSLANDGEVDLPTLLKHHGYTTAIAGKLHFYPQKHDWSFDFFWSRGGEGSGRQESYRDYMKRKYGKSAFQTVDGSMPYPDDPLGRDIARYGFEKEDYETYWLTDRSIEFLQLQKKRGEPFFLFTSFNEPHSPYKAVEPYASMYDSSSLDIPEIPEIARQARAEALERNIKGASRHLVDDPEMVKQLTAQYLGHVTNVDDNIGRLLAELDRLELSANTIVVFTADHGNMLGDHGRWFKGVMYEGSARIPLIIKAGEDTAAARVFNHGRVITEVVENVDVMPTLLELASLAIPPQIMGVSLVKLTAGQEDSWSNRAYSQRTRFMVRDGDYKLIADQSVLDGGLPKKEGNKSGKESALDKLHPPVELYNLSADPGEAKNLAGQSSQQRRLVEMLEMLRHWQATKPGPITIPGLATPAHLINTES